MASWRTLSLTRRRLEHAKRSKCNSSHLRRLGVADLRQLGYTDEQIALILGHRPGR
jgi:hypothetical protein